MIYFLCAILTYCNVCPLVPVLFCYNNKSALEWAEWFVEKCGANLRMTPEFDIQEEFHSVAASLGAELCFKHVQGHQHKDTHYQDLWWDAQLNIENDAEVAEFLTSPEQR